MCDSTVCLPLWRHITSHFHRHGENTPHSLCLQCFACVIIVKSLQSSEACILGDLYYAYEKKQHTGDWAHRLWFEPGNWDTTVFLDIRAERAFKLPSGSPRRDFSDKASVKFRWMCRKGTKARAAPCPKTSIHKNLIATLGGHSHVTRNQRKALGHETSLCWAERGR